MAERSPSDAPRSGAAGATRVVDRAGGRVMLVRRSRIEVVEGPDRGRELELAAEPIVIGAGGESDLQLTDPSVSAQHAQLHPGEHGFVLRDLGSTNGTFVAGLRITEVYLPDAATIELGETRLRFCISDDELELPLSRRNRFGELLGHSQPMRRALALLERVASSAATVLLEGESGTGKDLAARAIHAASQRSDEPMIAVDCGAIPPDLIESELFGHAKGAFTGADSARVGLFEQAGGGTLFLDEVGELPLELQPKLLRVLENRQLRRVGENRERPIAARIIAATNRSLLREVEAGRFRRDLYFRLSVIRVRMPPLRERREEIPRLVAHFLGQLGRDPSQRLPDSLLAALQSHRWPGNVRELRNVVERLAVLPDMNADFYLDDISSPAASSGESGAPPGAEMDLELSFHEGKQRWIERYERTYLNRMLERCGGNISQLARESGLSRQSCHRLLSRHGLV